MSQPSFQSFADLFQSSEFIHRHVGISQDEKEAMLKAVGADSMASFIEQTVPASVRLSKELDLPLSMTEHDALAKLRGLADKIKVNKSYIGLGYYPTRLPAVIARNVLENPGWYTAYTPYQAEIAQGRLEALLNFQQVCIDLSGLELAGASLLDEATAAAEAMAMAKRVGKSKSNQFFVDSRIYPQTLDVIKTRAKYFGWEIVVGDFDVAKNGDFFGAIFQYVGAQGDVVDLTDIISAVKAKGTQTIVAADVMSLVLLKSPGNMGADVALATPSALACRWVLVVHTRLILPLKTVPSALPQVVLLAYQWMPKVNKPCVWHYKPVSNISAAKKPTQIFVHRKCYWPIWQGCMRCIMVLKA